MTNWKSDQHIRRDHAFRDDCDDYDLGLPDVSQSFYSELHSMEIFTQNPSAMEGEALLQRLVSHLPSSSSPIHGRESCVMALQPSFPSSEGYTSNTDSVVQEASSYNMRGTLQSIVDPHLLGHHHYGSFEPLSDDQDDLLSHNAKFEGQNPSLPSKGNDDNKVWCYGSYSSSELSISSQQEPRLSESSGVVSVTSSGKSAPSGGIQTNRTRIKWTEELHKKFVDSVTCLGGAEKATPKAILNLMGSEGLTIYHVKSHLQKYRAGKYMADSAQGESERKASTSDVPHIFMRISMQMKEALQMQLDFGKHLREQLEIQQNLHQLIEERMKHLKKALEQKTNRNLHNSKILDSISQDKPSGRTDKRHASATESSENASESPS